MARHSGRGSGGSVIFFLVCIVGLGFYACGKNQAKKEYKRGDDGGVINPTPSSPSPKKEEHRKQRVLSSQKGKDVAI